MLPSHADLAAAKQARFFINSSVHGPSFDFVAFETPFQEAGQQGRSDTYPTDAYRENFLAWIREFVRVAQTPVTVESLPSGNTVMKTISDKPYHWHDHWVQWLMGDAGFTHLRELRNAGVIGIEIGAGPSPDDTCPCDAAHDGVTNGGRTGIVSRSADDDGGYLMARIKALASAGGLKLH